MCRVRVCVCVCVCVKCWSFVSSLLFSAEVYMHLLTLGSTPPQAQFPASVLFFICTAFLELPQLGTWKEREESLEHLLN